MKLMQKISASLKSRFNTLISRSLLKLNIRPSGRPYITGDGFRQMANHLYDETKECRASDIKDGEVVFVKSDKLPRWFTEVHPHITARYKLISHNSDYNITEKDLGYIDDKIIHWFAQNVKSGRHPKLTPIPLGLNNLYSNYLDRPSLYQRMRKLQPTRKNRIFFAFSVSTNPAERQPALDTLSQLRTADKPAWIKNLVQYLTAIMNYKFIACPDGNGNDDPRRWQAVYLGIVPIVTRTASMEYFQSLGLPFYIVDNWQELEALSEQDLARKYEELKSGFDNPKMFIDYWLDKIRHHES